MFDSARIKFNEEVWHEQAYLHPLQGGTTARDFYDRRETTEQAMRLLQSDTSRVVIIVGDRRTGKSSQLRHLRERVTHSLGGQFVFPDEVSYLGVRSFSELAHAILIVLYKRNQAEHGNAALVTAPPTHPPANSADFFRQLSKQLAFLGDQKLILAIDEFDSILINSIKHFHNAEEARRIVALVQALAADEVSNVRLLMTTTHVPGFYPTLPMEPLTPLCSFLMLHPFPPADLEGMVGDIVGDENRLTQTDLDAIYDLSGGWPFYAKLLLTGLAELGGGESSMQAAVHRAVSSEAGAVPIANTYLHHFTPDQKRVALLLARQDGFLTASEVATAGPAFAEAVRQLAEREIVTSNSDGSCRFRIALLAPWLRNWQQFDLEIEQYLPEFSLHPELNSELEAEP